MEEGLLIKLHDAGVKGMFYWIKDFFNNRSIQVKIGGDLSETVNNIINGTLQGSVISPVLFSIMINDIFSRVPNHFEKSLFADDVQWANDWGFTISSSKSTFMIFGNKRKIPALNILLYDCLVERVKEFKFLSLWMDERLTWKSHIEKVVGKCEKVINILQCLAGSDWDADQDTLTMIYRAIIRSILDYGCVVFGSAAKSVICKLDWVQAKALRVCNGAFRMTPIPALLTEMRELPLEIRRKKLGLHSCPKLSCSSYSSASRCLLESS